MTWLHLIIRYLSGKEVKTFVAGGKQYMFERRFYGLCGLPNLFSPVMTIHFAEMIAKEQVMTYIDDVILQAKTNRDMSKNLQSYRQCLQSSGLKAAPNKTKLNLRKVQFLRDIDSDKRIQPVAKTVPCHLMEGGCETTTLDSFAYTWDTPESCVMTKILTQDAKMFQYPLTTDQKKNQFFFSSESNDTGKRVNTKFKVFPESYELSEKPERLYKTNFEGLFVDYQGIFAMSG